MRMHCHSYFRVYSTATLLFPPQLPNLFLYSPRLLPLQCLVPRPTRKVFPIKGHSSITVVLRKMNEAPGAKVHLPKAEFDPILGLPRLPLPPPLLPPPHHQRYSLGEPPAINKPPLYPQQTWAYTNAELVASQPHPLRRGVFSSKQVITVAY
jgi:hypothetical protein